MLWLLSLSVLLLSILLQLLLLLLIFAVAIASLGLQFFSSFSLGRLFELHRLTGAKTQPSFFLWRRISMSTQMGRLLFVRVSRLSPQEAATEVVIALPARHHLGGDPVEQMPCRRGPVGPNKKPRHSRRRTTTPSLQQRHHQDRGIFCITSLF